MAADFNYSRILAKHNIKDKSQIRSEKLKSFLAFLLIFVAFLFCKVYSSNIVGIFRRVAFRTYLDCLEEYEPQKKLNFSFLSNPYIYLQFEIGIKVVETVHIPFKIKFGAKLDSDLSLVLHSSFTNLNDSYHFRDIIRSSTVYVQNHSKTNFLRGRK